MPASSGGGGNHSHRSGSLRQSNKKNKRSKASKRSLSRLAGGKVEGGGRGGFQKRVVAQTRLDRRNKLQQIRKAKKLELLQKRRGIVSNATALSAPVPRVIGIISLGDNENEMEESVRQLILQQANKVVSTTTNYNTTSAKYDVHKKDGYLTVLTNSTAFRARYNNDHNDDTAAVLSALDLASVCDLLLFVVNANQEKPIPLDIGTMSDENRSTTTNATNQQQDFDHLITARGDQVLSAIKGQGLPRVITVLARTQRDLQPNGSNVNNVDDDNDDLMTTGSAKSIRRFNIKRKAELKKYINRFALTEFGNENDKVMEIDLVKDYEESNDDIMNTEDTNTTATPITTSLRTINPELHMKQTLAASLVRTLCTMSASPSKWVHNVPRAYVVSDQHKYNKETNELQITGFIRGKVPFDVNALIHVPGMGTFGCKSISKAYNPFKNPSRKQQVANNNNNNGSNTMDVGGSINNNNNTNDDNEVVFCDPSLRESLELFATPDALDGEQNLVGFDDHDDEDDQEHDDKMQDDDGQQGGFARPAGWSDYQAAWLDAVDDTASNNPDNDIDHGELAKELNQKKNIKSTTASVAGENDLDNIQDANDISPQERQALLEQRRKEQEEHAEFPDEVQVDEDVNARDRYARYRALKSFRKSYWDPKENLPESYASIYHFANFKATQRSVLREMKDINKAIMACNGNFWGRTLKEQDIATNNNIDAKMNDKDDDNEDDDEEDDDLLEGFVPSGSYVTLSLEDVPQDIYESVVPNNCLLTAVTLLPHENKVSVVHMGLTRPNNNDNNEDDSSSPVIKSKDELIFRCGWRTWTGRPVFSQHNLNCDKHKFERFLPPSGAYFAASVFGPVTYTPCPVMVFRKRSGPNNNNDQTSASTRTELVAIGSMIGADADRIVVKRIILTGYPVRVHKRTATVKYMFYNPDDVKWFKPAGLTTKHGLQGNIEESVGEHGTMKCLFNAPIKQHDTVCLSLYKRIYPKFAGENRKGDDGMTVRTFKGKSVLDVK